MFNSVYEALVYLSGKAPVEPQAWFKPNMPERPNQCIWVSMDGKRKYTSSQVAAQTEGDNFHLFNEKEISEWEEEYRKQRYIQWPATWARMILETINE
jgi:hypothetical protein